MIKNIIFDFGGVLVDWNPRYYYRTYFNDDAKMEYFLANICNSEWNARLDIGVSYAENIQTLQRQYPEYADAIAHYRIGWPQMLKSDIPETVEVLKDLHRLGYGLYGLTNWSAETINIPFDRFPFFHLFRGVVVSGIEKMIKPDVRIYQLLLDRYSLKPEECVFVDDNATNVATATDLGIYGIRFENASQLRMRLEELLEVTF